MGKKARHPSGEPTTPGEADPPRTRATPNLIFGAQIPPPSYPFETALRFGYESRELVADAMWYRADLAGEDGSVWGVRRVLTDPDGSFWELEPLPPQVSELLAGFDDHPHGFESACVLLRAAPLLRNLDRLCCTCIELRGEFDHAGAVRLNAAMREVARQAMTLYLEWASAALDPESPGPIDETFSLSLAALFEAADLALATSRVRSIYEFGAAIGAYRSALLADAESLPDLRPIVRALRGLSTKVIGRSPLLNALTRLAPELEQRGQANFLRLLFLTVDAENAARSSAGDEAQDDLLPELDEEAQDDLFPELDEQDGATDSDGSENDPQDDASRLERALVEIYEATRSVLEKPGFESGGAPPRIEWDAEHRILLVDGEEECRFKAGAERHKALLGAFQDGRWPEEGVPVPAHPAFQRDPQAINQAIKDFNAKKTRLKLHKRGKRVFWEWGAS
jgi:hypothetical protein